MLNTTNGYSDINETTNSSGKFNKRRANLEVAKYLVICLTVLSFYVFAMLLYHWYIKKNQKTGSIATILCLLSSACSCLLSFNKLAELWLTIPCVTCSAYHQSATVVYGIGLALVYTTLWKRQRKLYSDELLANTVSKISRIISAAVIILIYSLLLFIFITFITVLKFEQSLPPCHVEWNPLSSLLPLVVFFITSCFILQLILFLLIVNPLRRGTSICRDVLCSNSSNDIHAMLKRVAVCACFCIFSTILLNIAILLDSVEIICIYWGNLVALDLLISTLSTTCSFADWSQKVFPWLPSCASSSKNIYRNSVIMESATERTTQTSFSTSETKSMLKQNGVNI